MSYNTAITFAEFVCHISFPLNYRNFLEYFVINKRQFLLGVLFLVAGTLEYLISRPTGSTYFLQPFSSILSYFHDLPNLYREFGFFAPDFFHPLAFSLMSMAFLSNKRGSRVFICFAWFSIDAVLELGQKYGAQLLDYLPQWLERLTITENLRNYLIYGTFDNFDLLAITLGSITAFVIGESINKGGKNAKQNWEQGII